MKEFIYSFCTITSVSEYAFENGVYKRIHFRPGNDYWNTPGAAGERGSADSRNIIFLLEKECAEKNAALDPQKGFFYVDARKVFSRIPEGLTRKEVMEKVKETPEMFVSFRHRNIPVNNGLILKTRVWVERETGNKNRETFDFVRVIHSLRDIGSYTALLDRAEKEKRHLVDAALEAIKNNRSYQKYGVPVSYLNITSVTVTRDGCCEILFELKGRGD